MQPCHFHWCVPMQNWLQVATNDIFRYFSRMCHTITHIILGHTITINHCFSRLKFLLSMQQDAMQAQAKIQNHLLKDFFPIWQMKLLKNCLTFIVLILKCSNMNTKLFYIRKFHSMEGFISTFSLLISLSITLWTTYLVSSGISSQSVHNQFTISSKYFDMVCYLKQETYSGPISFEVQQNDIWTDNIQ